MMNKLRIGTAAAAIYLWILAIFTIYLLQFKNIFSALLNSLGLT